jgi:hypothetical protein
MFLEEQKRLIQIWNSDSVQSVMVIMNIARIIFLHISMFSKGVTWETSTIKKKSLQKHLNS